MSSGDEGSVVAHRTDGFVTPKKVSRSYTPPPAPRKRRREENSVVLTTPKKQVLSESSTPPPAPRKPRRETDAEMMTRKRNCEALQQQMLKVAGRGTALWKCGMYADSHTQLERALAMAEILNDEVSAAAFAYEQYEHCMEFAFHENAYHYISYAVSKIATQKLLCEHDRLLAYLTP